MEERWHRWEPTSNLSKKYYIASIALGVGKEAFNIILIDPENKKVSVSFPHGIDAYRYTNESFALLTIDFLDETYGTNFYGKWTFFKIENSKYLKWIFRTIPWHL